MPRSNKDLVHTLKQATSPDLPLLAKLKSIYRPLICPLGNLLEHIEEGDKVFDIGCGGGQFSLLVAEYTGASSIEGIEVTQELTKQASSLLKGKIPTKFNVYNGYDIPDEVSQSDIIFLIDVIHHIAQNSQNDFLKSLHKKMKPGSKLVLKDIDASSPFVIFNKLHDLVISKEIGSEMTFANARETLKTIGFDIEYVKKEQLFWYPHFTIIAKKR